MKRGEQIEKEAKRVSYNGDEFHSFVQAAEWADRTMLLKISEYLRGKLPDKEIDKLCKAMEE